MICAYNIGKKDFNISTSKNQFLNFVKVFLYKLWWLISDLLLLYFGKSLSSLHFEVLLITWVLSFKININFVSYEIELIWSVLNFP